MRRVAAIQTIQLSCAPDDALIHPFKFPRLWRRQRGGGLPVPRIRRIRSPFPAGVVSPH